MLPSLALVAALAASLPEPHAVAVLQEAHPVAPLREPIVFSPDGRLVAVAELDGVALRESATLAARAHLATSRVDALAFSPDGARLAVAADPVVVWDLTSGGSSVLGGICAGVHTDARLGWASADRLIVSCGGDLWLLDPSSKGPVAHDTDPRSSAGRLVAWGGDLFAVSGAREVQLRSAKTGAVLHRISLTRLLHAPRAVHGLALSADGRSLAIGYEASVEVLDTASGKGLHATGRLDADTTLASLTIGPSGAIAFLSVPRGHVLIPSSAVAKLRNWSPPAAPETLFTDELPAPGGGSRRLVGLGGLVFDATGRLLSVPSDGRCVVELASRRVLRCASAMSQGTPGVSPDLEHFVGLGEDGRGLERDGGAVRARVDRPGAGATDLGGRALLVEDVVVDLETGAVRGRGVAGPVDPDGKLWARPDHPQRRLELVDVETGKVRARTPPWPAGVSLDELSLTVGRRLATGVFGHPRAATWTAWNTASAAVRQSVRLPASPIWSFTVSPDEALLAVDYVHDRPGQSYDKRVDVFEVATGRRRFQLEEDNGGAAAVPILFDLRRSRLVVAPSGRARIVDAGDGHTVAQASFVPRSGLSPDGDHAIAATAAGRACVLDLRKDACAATLEGITSDSLHPEGVPRSFVWSPDGGRCLAAERDALTTRIRVWNTATGALVYTRDERALEARFVTPGVVALFGEQVTWLRLADGARLHLRSAGGAFAILSDDGAYDGAPEALAGVLFRQPGDLRTAPLVPAAAVPRRAGLLAELLGSR